MQILIFIFILKHNLSQASREVFSFLSFFFFLSARGKGKNANGGGLRAWRKEGPLRTGWGDGALGGQEGWEGANTYMLINTRSLFRERFSRSICPCFELNIFHAKPNLLKRSELMA